MARKQKKLSRKQLAQQRREAITQTREAKRWTPPQAPAGQRPDELLEDMLPLFPLLEQVDVSSMSSMEPLMLALLDSGELIQEPEFENIILDPMLCIDTFIAVGEELGLDPGSFRELPAAEREDNQMIMLETTTRRLLTDELRQDIVNGLNELRQRLKRSGFQKKVAQVAALQSVLSGSDDQEMWPMIGLVQAIVHRSLAAGFELMEVSVEALDPNQADDSAISLPLIQKLAQSDLGQKVSALLEKAPGLGDFFQKQADKIWEEGVEAIFTDELYLELFTPDEIEAGLALFRTALAGQVPAETLSEDISTLEITEETGKALVSQVDAYLTELFTPERLDQLRMQLQTILNDKSYPKQWLAFLVMLQEHLAGEAAVEDEKPFLIRAFLGEIRLAGSTLAEAQA